MSHLLDDGGVATVYSVRHCEGDANEAWDEGPIAVDDEGSFYVTTTTGDDRFVAPQVSFLCIGGLLSVITFFCSAIFANYLTHDGAP